LRQDEGDKFKEKRKKLSNTKPQNQEKGATKLVDVPQCGE
jgi:hypothetical protein